MDTTNLLFPKSVKKKKKKKANGYKDKQNRYCYYCKNPYAERHEVYGGTRNRQISIDNKFQVDLCQKCHREITELKTEEAKERDKYWKKYFQKKYETEAIKLNLSEEEARMLWIGLIGKSYL